MSLDSGRCEMISALRAVHPDMGLKKFATHVNGLLPSDMGLPKHLIRDYLRSNEKFANEEGAEKIASSLRPRDESFKTVVKQAFVAFREAERAYMLDETRQETAELRRTNAGVLLNYFRHYIEVLLTLKGVKPCTLFCSNPDTMLMRSLSDSGLSARIFTAVVCKYLVPVLERFDIESYGFKLHYIANDVKTDSPSGRFKGSWVFADTQSPLWPQVRDIFFSTDAEVITSESATAKALGYPVSFEGPPEYCIEFQDRTEFIHLGGDPNDGGGCIVGTYFRCKLGGE
ncbi:hypothetical protein SLS53_001088 [Cytospora paraplurivora]|uniref:Uncharacterized protein n=1 Tax=Cytospora paraplurivora TaxID=2898453 RepID=A0AAN9UPS2_9PEZI